MPHILTNALLTGTLASVGSTAALALASKREGGTAAQPMNATSHWLHGESAATYRGIDAARTATGYATNHAASIFWAIFFEAWRARRPPATPLTLLAQATAMSAIAAAVDYGATPKRFTPGWEFVLSRKGMAIGYTGLALGLAAGAFLTQRRQ